MEPKHIWPNIVTGVNQAIDMRSRGVANKEFWLTTSPPVGLTKDAAKSTGVTKDLKTELTIAHNATVLTVREKCIHLEYKKWIHIMRNHNNEKGKMDKRNMGAFISNYYIFCLQLPCYCLLCALLL